MSPSDVVNLARVWLFCTALVALLATTPLAAFGTLLTCLFARLEVVDHVHQDATLLLQVATLKLPIEL